MEAKVAKIRNADATQNITKGKTMHFSNKTRQLSTHNIHIKITHILMVQTILEPERARSASYDFKGLNRARETGARNGREKRAHETGA